MGSGLFAERALPLKNQGNNILVLSPELWAGVVAPFHEAFQKGFKEMVSTFAWDPQSKTRWFPISYLVHVKQLVREHRLTTDGHLDNAYGLIQTELARRTALKRATSVDGEIDTGLTADYARLGLHPSCSRTLVEWAILLARKEGTMLGAPTTELLHKEEAYRRICAGVTP